ncbi:MAG: leucine--tRNA ligase [Chitinophagaceae bacterium]|nr:leucine--tRNA ligase [Chitinophagaceae bacterium]
MEYNFREIEKRWQQQWKETGAYKVSNRSPRPKYYVLDMFPYPSGAGLHVGHPLGYIASDIFARYKRLKGFNVLHPMGYDAFGLPAEQYAIDHGIHPAVSTDKNINTFRKQLDNIGFCYDWDREIRTSDPQYYKWTQWIFLQLFKSWYNRKTKKADSIDRLIKIFETEGNINHEIPNSKFQISSLSVAADLKSQVFSAADWASFDEFTQQCILMEYRLAYCGYGEVNWCEALGTVLANDEVINGVSERGGYPVIKKKLRQWYLRITEYADRLQSDLDTLEWSDAMKEMQTNWIGKSSGAEMVFPLSISPRRGEETEENEAKIVEKDKENIPGFGYAKYKVGSEMSFENAKRMRKEPTEAEKLLWNKLKNKATGYKFRRQHPIENSIADFVCLDTWLIVEVDGGYHENTEQQQLDKERDAFLKEIGFTTLRFTNEQVIGDVEKVVKTIKATCDEIKSTGAQKRAAAGSSSPLQGEAGVRVYTTRPDTIFGVDFMVLAPEHELVEQITTPEQKAAVDEYVAWVKSRSERERMAEKKISGCFTGAYAVNPLSGKEIPIWISEYVLAGYGTGAIMAVPSGDERDHKFARFFHIPITNIFGEAYKGDEAIADKNVTLYNSDFITGLKVKDAAEKVIEWLEDNGDGERKVNYKMRDAAFSRQRYWGEPFPIIWKDGIAYPMKESELPLELPHVDSYKPGPEGEGPLANISSWVDIPTLDGDPTGLRRETNTMPGYAGSSWYFLRYMDPHNNEAFCDREVSDYWNQVDLYIGGTEHAVGHLLYSRMWTKALYDLGYIGFNEPFKKLVNQGMIQGSSRFVYRIRGTNSFVSFGLKDQYEFDEIHVDVNIVDGLELDINAFKLWRPEFENAEFIFEDGKYICGTLTEKMSKRLFNTVNPDDLVNKYGADTFRMYEMFLGPVEQSKPWDTKGIEGVHRFLKKLWRLFYDEAGPTWTLAAPSSLERAEPEPTAEELKILHRTIKKIEEDTERFSFNTAVSAFMIAVNELTDLKCNKKSILEKILVLLAPYAPHVSEELWHQLGNSGSVLDAEYPVFEEKYIAETSKAYPVAINGKTRTEINIALDATQPQIEAIVMADVVVQKWLDGKPPKKIIYVKNRMINVVM